MHNNVARPKDIGDIASDCLMNIFYAMMASRDSRMPVTGVLPTSADTSATGQHDRNIVLFIFINQNLRLYSV